MEPPTARAIWQGLEHLNAVTYFAPECRDAPGALGLRGFWAGYFANRAAPMGPVPAGVVEATFFNFHPLRVRKSVPAVWGVASPQRVVESRAAAGAAALRRLLAEADELARDLGPLLARCIAAADGAGRVLFSANREIRLADGSVEALWQAATTLREHRGDGHVSVLVAEGLDGCEAHVLFAATADLPAELIQNSRGWSAADWVDATDRLVRRGLLDSASTPSGRGTMLRDRIEERTDELAIRAYASLSEDDVARVVHMTSRAARTIAAAALIPYPNPMGLPAPR